MPTGGLDADGVLELPIGDRVFRVLLGADFALTLTNPAGKPIKALPADVPPADAEELAAAKKAVASLRKELKQTAEAQTTRLYEAMCATRAWTPADFATYLLRHPIVAPLCRRLLRHRSGVLRILPRLHHRPRAKPRHAAAGGADARGPGVPRGRGSDSDRHGRFPHAG